MSVVPPYQIISLPQTSKYQHIGKRLVRSRLQAEQVWVVEELFPVPLQLIQITFLLPPQVVQEIFPEPLQLVHLGYE